MKKIKNKFHLLVGSLLTTLLGFLGVSCGGQILLYGVPLELNWVDLDGEVTNENGEPLESIQVLVNNSYSRDKWVDTLYTNASGEFDRQYNFRREEVDTLFIEVNDTSDVYASEKLQIPFKEMTKENEFEYSTEYSVDVKLQLKKK